MANNFSGPEKTYTIGPLQPPSVELRGITELGTLVDFTKFPPKFVEMALKNLGQDHIDELLGIRTGSSRSVRVFNQMEAVRQRAELEVAAERQQKEFTELLGKMDEDLKSGSQGFSTEKSSSTEHSADDTPKFP